MGKIKTLDIHDKVFEETYTAHIEKNGTRWLGWIPEIPNVTCQEPTEKALLQSLEKKIHETLVAEEEEWEKQFQADVKSGWLEQLSAPALQNYRDGKCSDLETVKNKG